MSKFEYKIIDISSENEENNIEILNSLGRDGWMLVSVVAEETAEMFGKRTAYLMRQDYEDKNI